jgi:hypothetical protein
MKALSFYNAAEKLGNKNCKELFDLFAETGYNPDFMKFGQMETLCKVSYYIQSAAYSLAIIADALSDECKN